MDILIDNPVRAYRGAEIGPQMFTDIPDFTGAWWKGRRLLVRFNRDLTTDERNKVLDRVQSATVTEEQCRTDIRAYLSIKNPSAQQDHDQIRKLTQLLLDDTTTGSTTPATTGTTQAQRTT